MPYTAKQKRFFHAAAERGEPGMKKLATEADQVPTLPPKQPSLRSVLRDHEHRLRESKRKR